MTIHQTALPPHQHTYDTLMKVSWNFDYESPIAKLDDLYARAKENQWNAADLAWDTPIDPSNPIIALEHSQYVRPHAVLQAPVPNAAGNVHGTLDCTAPVAVPAR